MDITRTKILSKGFRQKVTLTTAIPVGNMQATIRSDMLFIWTARAECISQTVLWFNDSSKHNAFFRG